MERAWQNEANCSATCRQRLHNHAKTELLNAQLRVPISYPSTHLQQCALVCPNTDGAVDRGREEEMCAWCIHHARHHAPVHRLGAQQRARFQVPYLQSMQGTRICMVSHACACMARWLMMQPMHAASAALHVQHLGVCQRFANMRSTSLQVHFYGLVAFCNRVCCSFSSVIRDAAHTILMGVGYLAYYLKRHYVECTRAAICTRAVISSMVLTRVDYEAYICFYLPHEIIQIVSGTETTCRLHSRWPKGAYTRRLYDLYGVPD